MDETDREQRIFEEEIRLIKTAFEGNTALLKTLRKVFYQEELTENEEKIIRLAFAGGEDLLATMKRLFTPRLSIEDPIGNAASGWIDRKYADKLTSEVKPMILARQDCLKALQLGIDRLEEFTKGGEGKPRKLEIDIHMTGDYENSSPEEIKRAAIAMQDLTTFVEITGLVQLQALSRRELETPEEKAARKTKDSAQ